MTDAGLDAIGCCPSMPLSHLHGNEGPHLKDQMGMECIFAQIQWYALDLHEVPWLADMENAHLTWSKALTAGFHPEVHVIPAALHGKPLQ